MTDKDLERAATMAYLNDLKKRAEDAALNEENKNKFLHLIECCSKMQDIYDCELNNYIANPSFKNGCVEVIFHHQAELDFEKSRAFKEAVELCDGINISSYPTDEEWFQITFFIYDLFDKN